MRFLRIKIDVAAQGFSDAHRNTVREHLRDLYCTHIPIRRLWLYLKTQRDMALQSAKNYSLDPELFGDGPEDVIVRGSVAYLSLNTQANRITAKDVVRPECLPLLMHFTVLMDIQHRKHPGLNPSSDFEFSAAGAERLSTIKFLAFSPGKLPAPHHQFTILLTTLKCLQSAISVTAVSQSPNPSPCIRPR
jgi:hypothetical protein